MRALQRHSISLERFDALLESHKAIRNKFDEKIHFPFLGLVREIGQSSFEGAATLARPPNLSINLSQNTPQSLKAVLQKYYTSLLYKLVCRVPNTKTSHERFCKLVCLLLDEKELLAVLDLYEIKIQQSESSPEKVEDSLVDLTLKP